MSNSTLLPAIDLKGISDAIYMVGTPRNYRFDGQSGIFYSPNKEESFGDKIKMRPFSVRCFIAEEGFMGEETYADRPFVQLFFLNKKGHVCSILVHSASARSFKKMSVDMFYGGVELSDVVLVLESVKESSSDGKFNYYSCKFSFEELDVKTVNTQRDMFSNLLGSIDAVFDSYTMTQKEVEVGALVSTKETKGIEAPSE